MSTIALTDRELLERVYSLLMARPNNNKTWMNAGDFMAVTGKTYEQLRHICRTHPKLKRTRSGEGVQYNYKEYQKIYQS